MMCLWISGAGWECATRRRRHRRPRRAFTLACCAHEAQPRATTVGQSGAIIDESGAWQIGRITIINGSDCPMWDVIVMSPDMHGLDFTSVGPEGLALDPALAGPESGPTPITPLAKLVQFIIRHSPEPVRARFHHLPDSLLMILWGYHPERGDGVDHLGGHIERVRDVRRRLNQAGSVRRTSREPGADVGLVAKTIGDGRHRRSTHLTGRAVRAPPPSSWPDALQAGPSGQNGPYAEP
jgi:hypothetical protein